MSAKTREYFYLSAKQDADILAWLENQENRSAAIRAAIRASWLLTGYHGPDVHRFRKDLEFGPMDLKVDDFGPSGKDS